MSLHDALPISHRAPFYGNGGECIIHRVNPWRGPEQISCLCTHGQIVRTCQFYPLCPPARPRSTPTRISMDFTPEKIKGSIGSIRKHIISATSTTWLTLYSITNYLQCLTTLTFHLSRTFSWGTLPFQPLDPSSICTEIIPEPWQPTYQKIKSAFNSPTNWKSHSRDSTRVSKSVRITKPCRKNTSLIFSSFTLYMALLRKQDSAWRTTTPGSHRQKTQYKPLWWSLHPCTPSSQV